MSHCRDDELKKVTILDITPSVELSFGRKNCIRWSVWTCMCSRKVNGDSHISIFWLTCFGELFHRKPPCKQNHGFIFHWKNSANYLKQGTPLVVLVKIKVEVKISLNSRYFNYLTTFEWKHFCQIFNVHQSSYVWIDVRWCEWKFFAYSK